MVIVGRYLGTVLGMVNGCEDVAWRTGYKAGLVRYVLVRLNTLNINASVWRA